MLDPHREFCKRQHRLIGHFLAIEAWLRKVDGLAIDRRSLEQMLGLERFKDTRIDWFTSDIEPWFPFDCQYSYSNKKLAGIWVSRIHLDLVPTGRMSDKERIDLIPSDGPRIAEYNAETLAIRGHTEIVTYLALLADGICSPLERFVLKTTKR